MQTNYPYHGIRVLMFLGTVVLLLAAIYLYNKVKQDNQAQSQQALQGMEDRQRENIRNNIAFLVSVGNSAYNYKLIGGISNLSLLVTNNTPYMLDNVRVKLSIIKADGALWQDQYIDFPYVGGHHTKTVRVPDSERGVSIKYQIISIK